MNLLIAFLSICGTAFGRLEGVTKGQSGGRTGGGGARSVGVTKGKPKARSGGALDASSLSGTYAVVLETGANEVSGLGTIDYDGEGGLTGTMRFNELDAENAPARKLSSSSLSGTYSLESSGLGSQTMTFDDFGDDELPVSLLVTGVRPGGATTVDGNFLVPSASVPGALQLFHMTKRVSDFGNGSLDGNYAFEVIVGPNMGHANGVITFDGEGGLTGQLHGNAPEDDASRSLFDTPLSGTYEAEHHGFVDMKLTFDTMADEVDFFPILALITEAKGTKADSLRGNFEVPSPIMADMDMPPLDDLVVIELEYLGPAGTTEVTATQ